MNHYNSLMAKMINILLAICSLYFISKLTVKKISVEIFLSILLTVAIAYFLNNYTPKKNKRLYGLLFLVAFPCFWLLSGSIISEVTSTEFKQLLTEIFTINKTLVAICVYIWTYMFCSSKAIDSNLDITVTKDTFYPERESDFNNILESIKIYPVLGIDGEWGCGKTFLMDKIKSELEKEYEIIEIDTLMMNFDKLQEVVLQEVGHIFKTNGIFSLATRKISHFFDPAIFKLNLVNLIGESNTFYNQFGELKKDFQKLEKQILFIFEDIDRIQDVESVIKIFNLSEKLVTNGRQQSSKARIIFQYSTLELVKNDKLTHAFLEKYLPHEIKITPITFTNTIKYLIDSKDNNISNVKIKDFDFMKNVGTFFFEGVPLESKIKGTSTRVILNYLKAVNEAIGHVKDYEFKELEKQTIVYIYFIKYFHRDFYENIDSQIDFYDQRLFEFYIDGEIKLYSFNSLEQELKSKSNENLYSFKRFELSENNPIPSLIFELFNSLVKDENNELEWYIQNILDRVRNEKVNRIIRNTVFPGKSRITNSEFIINLFETHILCLDTSLWYEKFGDFIKVYTEKVHLSQDHDEIKPKYPNDKILWLVKEYVAAKNGKNTVKIIEFIIVWAQDSKQGLNYDTTECLSNLIIETNDDLITCLEYIIKINIIPETINYETSRRILTFWNKYIKHLGNLKNSFDYSTLSLDDLYDYLCSDSNFNTVKRNNELKNILNDLIMKHNEEKKAYKENSTVVKELNIAVKFLELLLKILQIKIITPNQSTRSGTLRNEKERIIENIKIEQTQEEK